jgi:4-hydroxy-tetrahydrodipicolinate synthase
MNPLQSGLCPVMLTAFNHDRSIDWNGIDRLTDWYLESGASGLFANCLSSEMYDLSPEESLMLVKRISDRICGRAYLVAAVTFDNSFQNQADTIKKMFDQGVSAVVLIASLIASESESGDVFKTNLDKLLCSTGNIPLGIYECPRPYKRLIGDETLKWLADSGRFLYFKDTCCDSDKIKRRLEILKGASLKLFNADVPTLLHSLRNGAAGTSCIAANYYPELLVRLCRNFNAPESERLHRLLTVLDPAIRRDYPRSAKRFLAKQGLAIGETCRKPVENFPDSEIILEALHTFLKDNPVGLC